MAEIERDSNGRYLKGGRAWNKDMKMPEEFRNACSAGRAGMKLSESHKHSLSISCKGKNAGEKNGQYGSKFIHSKLIICRICGKSIYARARGQHELSHDPEYHRLHIEKIRAARLKQILPTKDTLPERKLQEFLTSKSITFIRHKSTLGICQPDITIEPNICIFADGDYWHSIPKTVERDILITSKLEKAGYTVLRFWEHDIHSNLEECGNSILKCLHKEEKWDSE